MWITRDINLPEKLITAQRENRLVIFAGAGVSMSPPSNLPDFETLAKLIADDARCTGPQGEEPLDRFLGQLDSAGIPVHERAYEIFSSVESRPNQLHRDLLSLFPDAQNVRMVTTNFDRHFKTVADELALAIGSFEAPALPLGNDFKGIVYLHGCVDQSPNKLILTDRDFGRAYLTDAWAARFLTSMFTEYTVLFVGYSHDDIAMRYLARALTLGTDRYAFSESGRSDWLPLGIEPVFYQLEEKEPIHGRLHDAIQTWANRCQMRLLDHEERIKSIAVGEPPEEPDISDYIADALSDETRTEFFVRYAHSVAWLKWIEGKQAFEELFQSGEDISQVGKQLAYWFAEQFAIPESEEALALLQRREGILHPLLTRVIASKLGHIKPRPEASLLNNWIVVLLANMRPNLRVVELDYLMCQCTWPANKNALLLLFDFLALPRIRLKSSFDYLFGGTRQVGIDVDTLGNEFWLSEAWVKILCPNLAEGLNDIEPIISHHLQHAHTLFRAFGIANDHWDPLSYTRSAIEPHPQDEHPLYGGISVLITAARDTLDAVFRNNPSAAWAIIDKWKVAGALLLRRLAVYGVTYAPNLSEDDKLAWLLENDYLYAFEVEHEVFKLLEHCYPSATEKARISILGRIREGVSGEQAIHLDEGTREYEKFNILVWLSEICPDCEYAKQALEEVWNTHPEFMKREHPDLSSWVSSGVSSPQSPLTVEQILRMNPTADLEYLESFKEERPFGPRRDGLLSVIAQAVQQDITWSFRLADALVTARKWDSDLWTALIEGWAKAALDEAQWRQILEIIRNHERPCAHSYVMAKLLEQRSPGKESGIPSSLLAEAKDLSFRLWEACEADAALEEPPERWLDAAIRDWAGKITEFWLHVLFVEWSEAREHWAGIPGEFADRFKRIASGTSLSAAYGRTILSSRFHILFAVDRSWAEANLLPLFNWDNPDVAQQTWQGFLFWGKWNEAMLDVLLPCFERTFGHLSELAPEYRDLLCRDLADIAFFSNQDPLSSGWINEFVAQAGEEDLAAFARHLGFLFRDADADKLTRLWKSWLKEYWDRRVRGIPRPFNAGELAEMVDWCVYLRPVFDEAVAMIIRSAPIHIEQFSSVYEELSRQEWVLGAAAAAARLLGWMTRGALMPFFHCSESAEIVRRLHSAGVPAENLLGTCENLARLQCGESSELLQLLRGTE